jgi:hypothetical protein
MSDAVWYWRQGEEQHGPITWEKLRSMAECGKIAPNDWVMRQGWPDWKLACEANDSGVDPTIGPPPEPPPLLPPLPPATHPITNTAPPPMHPSFQVQAPVAMMPVSAMGSAALPIPMPMASMPLPSLAPDQTMDVGPTTSDDPSDRGADRLRRVLRDGPDREEPGSEWNLAAVAALGASLTGLLVLAFEMGLLGVGLGGYCLYAASAGGNNNGKTLALTAVAIGGINVAFRVLCATVDLGLAHM